MLMMMSPFRYKPGMVTEEEVLSAMNRNGDGGFNEVLNKGDVFIYNYEEFRDYIEHPLFYLFHKLSIWKVSQKCEVRDETKDPRLYQFPQYWLYFCGTSLFLRQNKLMQDNWGVLPFAPGWSPELETDRFIKRLTKGDTVRPIKVLGIDWEKFDKGVIREHFECIAELRALWDYSINRDPVRFRAIIYYYSHICNRVCILPDGTIYYVADGNPSGHNNTTPDNNFEQVLRLYVIYKEYLKEFPDSDVNRNFLEFLEEIRFISFGDDGLCCAYNEVHLHFLTEFERIAKRVTGRGITIDHFTFDNFIFLGRRFFRSFDRWFSYGSDVNKASFGLINKLDRKHKFDLEIQDQRVYGHWQIYKNLHLHPAKDRVPQYKYLLALEDFLMEKSSHGALSSDVEKAFWRERSMITSYLARHVNRDILAEFSKTDANISYDQHGYKKKK